MKFCGRSRNAATRLASRTRSLLLDWLALQPEDRAARWDVWAHGFLTGGKARTFKGYCGPKLKAEEDSFKDELIAESQRILAVQEQLKAAKLAALNAHLVKLLLPIAAQECSEKILASHLSYADLVSHTGQLLIDPGAAWVLYKLDGGIEHLLLDEVQDTAPAQWEIANALAAEFFAGEGAREASRSIFAVGDAKQSIFSFQGADLKSFGIYREKFKAQAVGAGRRWLDGQLSVSFRSTAPVLTLTDAVFAEGPARDGVIAPGETLRHEVSRAGQAGRVTLWPLTQPREAAELPDWGLPEDYESADSAKAVLARRDRGLDRGTAEADFALAGPPGTAGGFPDPGAPARCAGECHHRRAEGARHRRGGAGPHGADRAAGGERSAGAVRRAAAAR